MQQQKRASWGTRPSAHKTASLDTYVSPKAGTKRLNINLPADLHRRIKVACAQDGTDMTAAILELLEQRFPPK